MVDPLTALVLFGVLAVATALVFWPGRGVVARLSRSAKSTERILLEDALKHVYTCQAVGRVCDAGTIADHLSISHGRAEDLLERLVEADLARLQAEGARLTPGGRESALRLVRAHRLWERYLADRTGVPAAEWHDEAERMEHDLSPEAADELSARLGHPRWDPHGDAIPTAGGQLPRVDRPSLSDVEAGQTVEVVHLEDEPREIYEALISDGIELGARLEVIETAEDTVRVRVQDLDWTIERPVAGNVTVRALPPGTRADGPVTTLLDLGAGEIGRVTGISPACQGSQRRRLLDLGVVRGTEIEAELHSALGDPVAYLIRGALIALRREQAEWIRIERVRRPTSIGSPS
jgi:DtxR family Mn-dependent transcriptional regulator